MRRSDIILLAIAWSTSLGTAVAWDSPPRDLSELSFDELLTLKVQSVTAAEKHEQLITEAPSAVSIVTSADIQQLGYQTLGEVLSSVRGFYTRSDRNYTYLGVRGFNRPGDYNDRVLFLVNGHRMNDNVTGGALIGPEFLVDVALIDRVEVVRGPGSALYGDNAFFAVVNVITKSGADLRGAEASVSVGSFETYRGRFSVGDQFKNGVDLFLSGTILERRGERELFYREYAGPASDGIARDADGESAYSMFGSLAWKDFSLEGGWVDRTKHLPTGSFDSVFGDPRNKTLDGSYFARLLFEHEFSEDFHITASLSYDRYHYDGTYIYPSPVLPATHPLIDSIRGRWLTEELQLYRTLWERLMISGGIEMRQNIQQDQTTYSQQPYIPVLDDRHRSDAWGPYLTASYRVVPRLTIESGFRYDAGDFPGHALSPRASIVYRPVDSTSLKLLYGRAFRGPNAYERFYTDGITQKPNPRLLPEDIDTYEAVWEQAIGTHWSASASAYLYEAHDLINQMTDPADGLLVYQNLDSVRGKGVEFEVSARYAHGLRGRASVAFQDVQDKATHARLSNSPRTLVQGNLVVPVHGENVFSGLDLRYLSSSLAPSGGLAPSYWVADVTLLTRRWLNGVELTATVDNIFDHRYSDPTPLELRQSILEQPGRTFWVTLTYRY